ncbi:MAG: DUF3857 and transglutaminase domain-containing protein, partial [Acidobacteriota bacterium]|nr:DUF3857 and transglutaminase domain-containing protein [Acidobacteriota bacterium]
EVLFWEARLADEIDGGGPRTVLRHYLRIKIFTERGRESQSRVDIPFSNNAKIKDLAARTIKPDGTIIELQKKDVFERTIVKQGGRKVKAKSFALPGVEPGAIIEYRYREVRNDNLSFYEELDFARDIPVQSVKYSVKPLFIPGFGFQMRSFNGNVEQTVDKDKGLTMSMRNVPAFREEPRMPPEYEVRPWIMIYYTTENLNSIFPDKYWKQFGKDVFDEYKSSFKVKDDVRAAALAAVGDAQTPEQKIERLLEFCRAKIKNTSDDAAGLTDDDREKLKENKSASDTLKRGMGNGRDISLLFGAMATAVGLEARVVRVGNRGEHFFNPSVTIPFFLSSYDIALKVGDGWQVIDPSSAYVPYGMLLWQEEGQQALLSDPKEATFIKTPLSGPEKSVRKRTAKLKLAEDGTLEGDVRLECTGHAGMEMKEFNDDDSPNQREETLKDDVKKQMSTAELSDIRIENVTDPIKPFVYAYHVRVPGYAQRTGKRLFLQPAFFQRGVEPLFASSERRNAIYFNYAWSEDDTVEIELPAGFALDSPDAPDSLNASETGQYDVKIFVTPDKRRIIYQRKFYFGTAKSLLHFPRATYPALKQLFDELHKRDNHTLTLKQAAASAATSN